MFEDNPLLLLFIIMLLGMLLCSFLGGSRCSNEGFSNNNSDNSNNSNNSNNNNKKSSSSSNSSSSSSYDNYNHYTGDSFPSVFYASGGGTAKVIQSDSGNIISVTDSDGNTNTFKISSNNNRSSSNSAQTFNGPNGMTAIIVTTDDGDKAIRVTDSDDNVIEYVGNQANDSVDDMTSSPMNEEHTSFNSNSSNSDIFSNEDSELRGGNNDRARNSPTSAVNNSTGSYDAYLPPGIPKSEIPPGDEGLYILKSQVVPPVCPACPAYGPTALLSQKNSSSNSETTDSETTDPNKCPPCPACERCPEPSYACKLVPNYGSNNSMMPVPVLSAFSTFGM